MKYLTCRKNNISVEWELSVPFTNGSKWFELEIYKRKWFNFSFNEIYETTPEQKRILGSTDNRTVFDIGFRIPFVKELN